MVKVLEVFREPLANGGQESFIMNMLRNMDHDQIQMDFMTPFTCDNQSLKAEVESYGGRVYTYDHEFGKNNNQVFKESLSDFLSSHSYETVHFHSGSTYALMMGPKIASEAGVKNRIVHSHCGGDDNLKYRLIKAMSVPYFMKYPTQFCACSMLAAKWKFPKKIIDENKVDILKNAVDLDRFHYDPKIRDEIRAASGLKKEIVLGHIGRFSRQKNQLFLIDIFNCFLKRHADARLWLVGEGEDLDKVKSKVRELGIEKQVDFLGLRKDIPDLLNAMDALVLPSLFEGLPVVGVEAQAVSLPVIASEEVTKEMPVPELSRYLSLEPDGLIDWIEAIEEMLLVKRKDRKQEMIEAGYEVKEAAAHLQNLYLNQSKEKDDDQ
ncbi:glycosyltransferase [Ileibacterium valens]|uniref:glycosyltransferase n=1 Tax=Ileibacterium valens TaxID=1862668 RepID=UPI00272B6742|nr:glycosyltransferase [Ileibacterium valens]